MLNANKIFEKLIGRPWHFCYCRQHESTNEDREKLYVFFICILIAILLAEASPSLESENISRNIFGFVLKLLSAAFLIGGVLLLEETPTHYPCFCHPSVKRFHAIQSFNFISGVVLIEFIEFGIALGLNPIIITALVYLGIFLALLQLVITIRYGRKIARISTLTIEASHPDGSL